MAGPKTLGGWVITNHGVRAWWSVQRMLLAWGSASIALGRRPEPGEVIDGGGVKKGTYYRDLHHFEAVFPGREPFDVWDELYRASAMRRNVADVIQAARWSA